MNKHLLFTRKNSPQIKLNDFIIKYNLKCSYKNKTEYIYENNTLMISITKYVTHIVLYNANDTNLEYEIKKFFYGEKYAQFKNIKL